MKRAGILIMSGLVLAVAAFLGSYYAGTANCRQLAHSDQPELAWLKEEFHLDNTEFTRICQLHESYLAGCAERCRLIDEKNNHLKHLLAETNAVTPEIEKTLAEAAQLRAECQSKMLQQFYEVSRTMPPEQGKRYLTWVQARTLLTDAHQGMHPSTDPPMAPESHH